jgi:hypothetical protein
MARYRPVIGQPQLAHHGRAHAGQIQMLPFDGSSGHGFLNPELMAVPGIFGQTQRGHFAQ